LIRVLIVADIRLYREGLVQILAAEPRLKVVGAAAELQTALQLVAQQATDVALVDMVMPHSIAAVRGIAATAPGVKVVALGIRENEQDLIDCAEAGVAGYVARAASVEDLVAALEGVGRGELLCSPQTAATLLRRVAALASGASGAGHASNMLTPREREIGSLLEAGLSNKDIAVRLGIEVATVKNHVHNLLEKLQVHRRAQAVARLQGRMPIRRATPVP
jgi:two-component system nitrate/nitrite response regulator NarL